jgi:hypothetical protein
LEKVIGKVGIPIFPIGKCNLGLARRIRKKKLVILGGHAIFFDNFAYGSYSTQSYGGERLIGWMKLRYKFYYLNIPNPTPRMLETEHSHRLLA